MQNYDLFTPQFRWVTQAWRLIPAQLAPPFLLRFGLAPAVAPAFVASASVSKPAPLRRCARSGSGAGTALTRGCRASTPAPGRVRDRTAHPVPDLGRLIEHRDRLALLIAGGEIGLFLRVEQEVETAGEMAAAPDARPRDRRPDRRSRSQVAADVAQAGNRALHADG